ncbi:methylthioribulose 1-phosphate dehydratase [Paenisporosarcina antarctica]|uniref:Methylthioribulose-1-phosphate dehydratase n=1 Tax=Paenisporosarcina antarctica TaxID=417367 RepID=A0A4V1AN17_9BACL|nr:methylthioribulose 1-phosphate dehydratase [Paenisporosarcina antarctica]QBP41215.1 methylthioribulose 1-phosphate dehydratase [Paenisporosarcina antarctica]
MKLLQEKWNELADIKDELATRDWFMGTSGNLSIKVNDSPTQFLVSASGKDKRKRTSKDFLVVDNKGSSVEVSDLRPSAETLLHCAVYNNSTAGCSLHVHTVANNVISELYGRSGKIDFKGLELIKAFNLWQEDDVLSIPIIHNFGEIPKLAEEFQSHVKSDKGAVLIRNHGITVWGVNGFEAKKLLEACEFLFQYQLTLDQLNVK